MTEDVVGDAEARLVHGFSAGADVVVVDPAVCRSSCQGATAVFPSTVVPASVVPATVDPASVVPATVVPGTVVAALRAAGVTGALTTARGSTDDILSRLAAAAADGEGPLVVIAAGLTISAPALLDLLDSPQAATATLTVEPDRVRSAPEMLAPARVGPDGRLVESVGTRAHSVSGPNCALLGVLRLAPADRLAAARLWTAAGRSPAGGDVEPWSLSVLALVRGGVPVRAQALGPYAFSRGAARSPGASGGPWHQRLRAASRGGDGLLSTFAVRPLSRRVTAYGLERGWQPNVVTVVSVALGLGAAGLVDLGHRWSWALGALLLVMALVLDCVDGELARFRRRFSPFGAWLDAVGDRVKEYAVIAAVAAAGSRAGRDLWWPAMVTMAVVCARHFEDSAYQERGARSRASRPVRLPLDRADDGGDDGGDGGGGGSDGGGGGGPARTSFLPPASARQRQVRWAKQVLHMPIAERYLVMVVGLLLFRADWLLWALLACVGVSMLWSHGGRTVKAVLLRDGYRPDRTRRWAPLDHRLDVGAVAGVCGRVLPLPVGVAFLGAGVLAASVALRPVNPWAAPAAALLGGVLVGAGSHRPVRGRLAWQLPTLLWLAEATVVTVLSAVVLAEGARGLGYGLLAAVAYHRYDVGYRLRETATPPAPWSALAGLGAEGRVVVLLLLAAGKPSWLGPGMAVLAAGLGTLYAAESAAAWRRRPGPVAV